MDFSFTDEQSLLQDSVARFVQDHYSFEDRQQCVRREAGFSAENWRRFADLGWLGLPFSEGDGGFGASSVELMLIMEQFGRGMVVEPYLATVVLAGGALRHGGTPAQKEKLLPSVIDGSKHGALAYVEPQGRFDLADVTTTAESKGGGYRLRGYKAIVLNGPAADFFVVSARTAGGPRDPDGVSLFIVDANAAGISRRNYATVDGFRASEVTFENVELGPDALLGELGGGLAVLERVIDEGIMAIGSEAVGCMEAVYQDTVEYCRTREQFGQPIAEFQVLQHRMVDMFMEHEKSKSLMFLAAIRMDEGYGDSARKALSAFKVQVGKSGRFVGQNAVQLHGGMGMTDGLRVGHYFKRLTAIDALFGNVDHHISRFGAC